MHIENNILPIEQRGECPEQFQFGETFTDHMFCQRFTKGTGWHDAKLQPYQSLSLDPAASVLHYGQEIFEGLKAYRAADGGVNLFRPLENCKRFNRSAARMVMPQIAEQDHLDAIKALVSVDQKWVPNAPFTSLYLRPTMVASGRKLGLGPSSEYLHFVIASPAGSYFKGGFTPISVYITERYRRAVVGGVGEAKTGGNYAASLLASEEVTDKGYSQVLWLDAVEGKYIEEVGAMNICFVYNNQTIVTPALSGSILPGITRDSILKLAPTLGFDVSEERLDVNTILADIKSGKITECFGCGTAAVISPVGTLGFMDNQYQVNGGEYGPVAKKLYDTLNDIQYSRIPDEFGWIEKVV